MEELRCDREEQSRKWAEQNRKWEESKAESERKWAEQTEQNSRLWLEVGEQKSRLDRKIGALGARWGIGSESFSPGLGCCIDRKLWHRGLEY